MGKQLLKRVENDFYEEAKRLLPLLYDEKKLIFFDGNDLKDKLDIRFNEFYVDIQLILIKLCEMKYRGQDYTRMQENIDEIYDYYTNLISFRNNYSSIDIHEVVKKIKAELGETKYSDKDLYIKIPNLLKQYNSYSFDSIDYIISIILL